MNFFLLENNANPFIGALWVFCLHTAIGGLKVLGPESDLEKGLLQ